MENGNYDHQLVVSASSSSNVLECRGIPESSEFVFSSSEKLNLVLVTGTDFGDITASCCAGDILSSVLSLLLLLAAHVVWLSAVTGREGVTGLL